MLHKTTIIFLMPSARLGSEYRQQTL